MILSLVDVLKACDDVFKVLLLLLEWDEIFDDTVDKDVMTDECGTNSDDLDNNDDNETVNDEELTMFEITGCSLALISLLCIVVVLFVLWYLDDMLWLSEWADKFFTGSWWISLWW